MSLIKYIPTKHFHDRYRLRCNDLDLSIIKKQSKNLCNRNEYGIYLFKKEDLHYIIHTNNKELKLLTIYSIDYADGFKDFIKFYITKPRVLKHDMKFKSFEKLFQRILSKYNNKLNKTCETLLMQKGTKDIVLCRNIFCQTVYDYKEFYFKYLNEALSFNHFISYCNKNKIKLDSSISHSTRMRTYISKKLNKEQLMNFSNI